ncbi:MAG: hypothetical protein AAGE98_07455 [Actinomycetota bacterium]
MTTRQLTRLFVWGFGVLVVIAVAIVAWAWSVPDIVDPDGDLVTDTARVQTRTLVVLLVGFVVGATGAWRIVRAGRPKRERRPDEW